MFSLKRSLPAIMLAALLASNASSQWMPVNGPVEPWQDGATPQSMVYVDSILIMATEQALLHSYDQGASWTYIRKKPDAVAMYLTARKQKIYSVDQWNHNLYVSTNYGVDWSMRLMPVDTQFWYYAIGEAAILVTSFTGKFYRSTDDGITWSVPACVGLPPGRYALASSEKYFYAGSYRSSDNGDTWESSNSPMPIVGEDRKTLYRDKQQFSTDDGQTWTSFSIPHSPSAPNASSSSSTLIYGHDSIMMYYIEDYESRHGFVVGRTNYFSSNRGKTWRQLWTKWPASFYSADTVVFYYGGGPAGSYRSTDWGKRWEYFAGYLGTANISALLVDGDQLFAGGDGGAFRSSDLGGSWNHVYKIYPAVASLAVNDSFLFMAKTSLAKSSDKGDSWIEHDPGGDHVAYSLFADGPLLFIGNVKGIYRSTTNGVSWESTNVNKTGQIVYRFAKHENMLYATTNEGIYESDQTGRYWERMTTNSARAIVSHGPYLIAGGSSYDTLIYRSSNNGGNWEKKRHNIKSIILDLLSYQQYLFAATTDGVYISFDDGGSWKPVSTGLPPKATVSALVIQGDYLFAGSTGVWRRALAEIIAANVDRDDGTGPVLKAHPNPVHKQTTLSVLLPAAGEFELVAVNIYGVEVAQLFKGNIEAGEHTFTWEPEALAPGIYLCVLKTSNGTISTKLLVH